MSFGGRIKELGGIIGGLAIIAGFLALGVGLLVGAARFSLWVMEWTFPAFSITVAISVLVLAPLALIPPTRGFSAVGLSIASVVLSMVLWLWGMAYTYSIWGFVGVIIGLLLFGVGVVPVAMFAALVHGDWGNLTMFAVTVCVVYGFRMLANWLGEKADERRARLDPASMTIEGHQL